MRRLVSSLILGGAWLFLVLLLLAGTSYGQSVNVTPWSFPTFVNASGVGPNSNGFVCTYASGTTSVLLTYQDDALATPNQDPIRLDSHGQPVNGSTPVQIFLQPALYKFVVYAPGTGNTCNGVTVGAIIKTVDPIYDLASLMLTGNVTFPEINNRVFCTTGANFGAKFTAAVALLPSTGGIVDCSNLQGAQTVASDVFSGVGKPIRLLWPSGTVTANVSFTQPATMAFDFGQAGILSVGMSAVATINGSILGSLSQHFSGGGSVDINNMPLVYPQWWSGNAGASISSAISSLTTNGGVVDARGLTGSQTIATNVFSGVTTPITLLLGSATYTVSVAQSITQNKSSIQCSVGTTLTKSGNFTLITISGSDDFIQGCALNGGGTNTGEIISLSGSTRAVVQKNTITNYGNRAIYITNATNPKVLDNSISGGQSTGTPEHGIMTSGSAGAVSGVVIQGNSIDIPSSAAAHTKAIELISENSGSDVGNITVSGNILSTAVSFCVEEGAFDTVNLSNFVHDITVTGNTCTATANGEGGFSAGGGGNSANIANKNVVFSNNTYNAAGFTMTVGGIEISGAQGFSITGNVIRNASGVVESISLSTTADDGNVVGNTIIGFQSGSSKGAIHASVSSTNDVLRKVTISGNVVEFTAGNAGIGIWVQCNLSSAICRNVAVSGNTVFADGTTSSVGIKIENDAGVMENITVNGNSIYKTYIGIQVAGVNGLTVTNNTYDAANVSANIAIYGSSVITNFNISNNTITSLNAGAVAYTIPWGMYLIGAEKDGTISGNQISGITTTAGSQAGIRVEDTTASSTMSQITISTNTIDSHGAGPGIFVNCNATTATCQDVVVENNNLVGDGTASSQGVNFSQTAGTMQRITVSNNKIQNFNTCVQGSNVVAQVLNNRFDNCSPNLGGLGSNVQVVDFSGTTIANVPTLANGSVVYVSDSTIANPCAGGGSGAILKRLNGVNVCN